MNSRPLSDHKFRQKIYLTFNRREKFANLPVEVKEDASPPELVEDIVDYFTRPQDRLVYPAKAYAVAIIYSLLLEKLFALPFQESLGDKDLFQGTDRFYKSAREDRGVYAVALERLDFLTPEWLENCSLPQVRATIECFHQEFYTNLKSLDEVMKKSPYCDGSE